VTGLYQNGACAHPGGSVSGLPGRNCAEALLRDLGSSLDEAIAGKKADMKAGKDAGKMATT
jgi:hypothetical protein